MTSKRETLATWIGNVTGYDDDHIIYGYGQGPKPPTGDFAMFSEPAIVERVSSSYIVNESTVAGVTTRDYVVPVRMRVAVNIFALDGVSILEELALSPVLYQHRNTLVEGDLTFINASDSTPVPSFDDTGAEYRNLANFFFYSHVVLTETDYELQRVEGTGIFVNPDDTEDEVSFEVDLT